MATSISERQLLLTTNNPQAEILLLDGSFRVVSRGLSPLRSVVASGLYAMKVKVGDEETEELITVEPSERALEKFLGAPKFESPIPLDETSTTHESHQEAVDRFLQPSGVGLSLGTGSAVMICVRDPSKTNPIADRELRSNEDIEVYAASFKGFNILNAAGACLVDLDEMAEHNLHAGYMALTVELEPGSYSLAYSLGSDWVCLPLPTARGWTLQVYINLVSSGGGDFQFVPDLSDLAMVFDRISQGFSPQREDLFVGETVRKGLMIGCNYVDTPTMSDLLSGKFENPMLGLYAAHLLLLEPSPKLELIHYVIQNTARMIGEQFPDVVALTAAYENRGGLDTQPGYADELSKKICQLSGPPLLTRSWELLVDATKRLPPAAIASAVVFKMAGDVVAQGVFLAWRRPLLKAADKIPAYRAESNLGGDEKISSFKANPAPASTSTSSETLRQPSPDGSIVEKLVGYSGSVISVVTKAWKTVRSARAKATKPNLATQIAQADSNEKVAAALREIAKHYDWKKLFPELRKETKWLLLLSGLQRDLLLMLRDVSGDPDEIEEITEGYVARLLESHRVPLGSLIEALADMELSGWMTTGVKGALEQLSENRRRKLAVRNDK